MYLIDWAVWQIQSCLSFGIYWNLRKKVTANCMNCIWFLCYVGGKTQHLWAIICQIIDLCILIFRHWPPCQMILIHSLTKYKKACPDLQFNIIVQGQLSICLNSIQISIIRINRIFFCSHYLLILSSIFALRAPIHSSLLLFIATALSPLHFILVSDDLFVPCTCLSIN